jgi:hypothetical protein
VTVAGIAGHEVRGTDHALGLIEVAEGIAVAERVVAERDHVGAHREDVGASLLGDPEPSRGVLAVDDYEVGLMALAQSRHRAAQAGASRAAHHVADEEHPHATTLEFCA